MALRLRIAWLLCSLTFSLTALADELGLDTEVCAETVVIAPSTTGLPWTQANLEAAVRALHGKVALNASLLKKDESAATADLIEAAIGFRATGKQLLYAAENRGGYGKLLDGCGLKPQRADTIWNRTKIIAGIQELHRRGLPLNTGSFRNKNAEVDEALKSVAGVETTGLSFQAAAKREFETWEKALIAAGLDPKAIVKRVPWSEDLIVRCIKALHAKGVELNPGAIVKDKRDTTVKILKDAIGYETTGTDLYEAAVTRGGWAKFLELAGLNPKDYALKVNWNRGLIVSCVKALHAKGLAINSEALRTGTSEEAKAVLREVVGQDTTPLALWASAMAEFGNWSKALEAAGFDPNLISERTEWTRDMILTAIGSLDGKYPMHAKGVIDNAELPAHLKVVLGKEITGAALYDAASIQYGSWDKALVAAGFDPVRINAYADWSAERVIACINALNGKIPLNVEHVMNEESPAFRDLIRPILGKDVSGRALVSAANRHYGSWSMALTAAGISPASVRRTVVWDRDLVIKAIKALEPDELNANILRLENSVDLRRRLREITGYQNAGVDLYAAAIRHFGSWESALWAAEIDPATVKTRIDWNRVKMIAFIKFLKTRKYPLGATALLSTTIPEVHEALTAHFGPNATLAKFIFAAKSEFRSWKALLTEAGVEDRHTRLLSIWDGKSIVKAIRGLKEAGTPLEANLIHKDVSPETRAILSTILGRSATGRELYLVGGLLFQNWETAVAFATTPGADLTREQVAKAIRAMEAARLGTEMADMKNDADETIPAVELAIGIKLTRRDLYYAAVMHFGSWRIARRLQGIQVNQRSDDETNMRSDRARLVFVLRLLHEKGVPLGNLDWTVKQREVLEQEFGKALSPEAFRQACIVILGSWSEALRAADLNPREILVRYRWTRADVFAALVHLAHSPTPLEKEWIAKDESAATQAELISILHRQETGRTLYFAAVDHFGSWEKALAEIGLAPSGKSAVRLPADKIQQALRELHEAGIPLSELDIATDTSEATLTILNRVFGKRITGGQFYHAARMELKMTWVAILREAGLDLGAVRRDLLVSGRYGASVVADRRRLTVRPRAALPDFTREEVIAAIQALRGLDLPLHAGAISRDTSESTKTALTELLKTETTGRQIYLAAKRHFAKWDDALTAAGIEPKEIPIPGFWNKAKVEAGIRLLVNNGISPSATEVSNLKDAEVLALLSQVLGKKLTSGASLYFGGRTRFGSWDEALRAAGVNPGDVRQTFSRRANLSMVPSQAESSGSGDDFRVNRLIGTPPEAPDRALELETFHELIDQALSGIPGEDQRSLARAVIECILGSAEVPDPEVLADVLTTELGREITPQQVRETLALLAEQPALHSLRSAMVDDE